MKPLKQRETGILLEKPWITEVSGRAPTPAPISRHQTYRLSAPITGTPLCICCVLVHLHLETEKWGGWRKSVRNYSGLKFSFSFLTYRFVMDFSVFRKDKISRKTLLRNSRAQTLLGSADDAAPAPNVVAQSERVMAGARSNTPRKCNVLTLLCQIGFATFFWWPPIILS